LSELFVRGVSPVDPALFLSGRNTGASTAAGCHMP